MWAIWARRLGSFALPLTVVPIFLHRQAVLPSDGFMAAEILALACACLGLVIALGAFARLWVTGDRGWSKSVTGALLSLLCLLPFAYVGYLANRYPMVIDLSTEGVDPPPLIYGPAPRTGARNDPALISATFPNVQTRFYPLSANQVFTVASAMAATRGWDIRVQRGPDRPLGEGQINALAVTLFGWRHEVSIRVRGEVEGSTVAMRSASLIAVHDLGENGRRIEDFLLALDAEVTMLMRDTPAAEAEPGETVPIPETPPD